MEVNTTSTSVLLRKKNKIHLLDTTPSTPILILGVLLLLVVFSATVTALIVATTTTTTTTTVERRRSVLLPWTAAVNNNGDRHDHHDASAMAIGWAIEERSSIANDDDGRGWQVTISLSSDEKDDHEPITVHLPWKEEMERHGDSDSRSGTATTTTSITENDLAHSLWPGGIAGAILARHLLKNNKSSSYGGSGSRMLELGSGLGLMGWVAGAASNKSNSTTVELTDHDASAVELLQRTIPKNENQPSSTPRYRARYLEWRDEHDNDENTNKFDVILGADVAYYFYLLRPLMDTINAFLKKDGSTVLMVGQANRQSQWDLYGNMVHGCYNQLTDEHEAPWPGRTRMLLYRLQMSEWTATPTTTTSSHSDDDIPQDSIIPLAVLLHERNHSSSSTIDDSDSSGAQDEILQECDYVATTQDQEEMLISF